MPFLKPNEDDEGANYRRSMRHLYMGKYASDRMNDEGKPNKGCLAVLFNVLSASMLGWVLGVLIYAIFGG